MIHKLRYKINEKGDIILPKEKPFDGSDVLVRTTTGWVQAYWVPYQEYTTMYNNIDCDKGFYWVCYDDKFELELDEVLEWMEIPYKTFIKERAKKAMKTLENMTVDELKQKMIEFGYTPIDKE